MADSDVGFVPTPQTQTDDLGFVPQAQTKNHDDLGFIPEQRNPDMGPAVAALKSNVASVKAQQATPSNVTKDAHPAQGFFDDWMAGWQQSTTALGITRQSLPDTYLPEDAGTVAKFLAGAGTIAGDLPAMLVGGTVGQVMGSAAGEAAAGPLGARIAGQVGRNAGAFALPAAIRKVLMDHYQKGDIQTFGDFYERASGAFLESLKAGTVGAATGAAGLGAGVAAQGLSPMMKLGAVTGSELATMVTVGKAMDGKVPNAQDFLDGALLLGAMHGVGMASNAIATPISEAITSHIQNKLQNIYSETGLTPLEAHDLATNDPVVRQEMLSDDPGIPQSLKAATDPNASTTEMTDVPVNKELGQPAPSLSSTSQEEGAGTLKVEPLSDAKDPSKQIPSTEEPIKRTDAEKSVLDRIGVEEPKQKQPYTWDKFYYQFVDKYDPIKLAVKALNGEGALGAKDDPYALVRSISTSGKRAEAAIESGPADFKTLEPTGTESLKSILEPHLDDIDGFKAYMVASRAVELESHGKETGVDISSAKQVVADGKGTYEKSFRKFVDFNNDILKYGKDAGIISEKSFDNMVEMNKNYVSFKRIMGAEDEGGGSGTGRGLTPFSPVKELKGSERQLVDPIDSTIKNTQAIIALAEKNRAILKLTDMIDKAGNPEMGEKVSAPMKPIDIMEPEVAKFLKSNGLDPNDAAAFTIFRANQKGLEDNQIASYKDGKRQIYEVPKELAASVKQLDDQDVGNVVKMLALPAKGLRTGMIASPDFQARHFIRQEFMSTIFAKDLYIPVATTIKGLGELLGKTEDYYDWLRAWGANDSIADIGNDTLKKNLFGLNEETGFLDKAWNTIKAPIEGLKMITQYLDEARTLGKFMSGREAGKDIFQANLDARDSAIDVARVGASMRAWNMVTPFENMRIQGLDLIGRNFQENPAGTMVKLTATITLPSVCLWYANHQDERWRDIPNYVKDTSFIFMTKNYVFRIPKPFEPGVIFGSLPERILEKYFTDNPRAFKDFESTMIDSAMPQYIPSFAAPVLEQYANKSLMTGNPLISDHMKNVLPAYQSNPYSSTTGKMMAGILRTIPTDLTQKPGSIGSPIILDNYVRAWGGNLGQYAMQAMDKALEVSGAAKAIGINYNEVPPEKTLADIPFIKAFVIRYPSANSQAIGDFYNRFESIQTRLNSISLLAKQGDFKSMQNEMVAAQASGQMVNLTGYRTAIGQQMQLIQKIYASPDMDPHEKRQQIDKFYTLILNEAHGANKILDGIEQAVGK